MKIYLSATYRDLQRYRLAVSMALRRMGHQVIGMEDYVAEDVRPLGRCLDDVAACDVYIGLLAWRYGYVPTDAQRDGPSAGGYVVRQVGNRAVIDVGIVRSGGWVPAFRQPKK